MLTCHKRGNLTETDDGKQTDIEELFMKNMTRKEMSEVDVLERAVVSVFISCCLLSPISSYIAAGHPPSVSQCPHTHAQKGRERERGRSKQMRPRAAAAAAAALSLIDAAAAVHYHSTLHERWIGDDDTTALLTCPHVHRHHSTSPAAVTTTRSTSQPQQPPGAHN